MDNNLREPIAVALQLNGNKRLHEKIAQQSKTGICYLIFDEKHDISRVTWLEISDAIPQIQKLAIALRESVNKLGDNYFPLWLHDSRTSDVYLFALNGTEIIILDNHDPSIVFDTLTIELPSSFEPKKKKKRK